MPIRARGGALLRVAEAAVDAVATVRRRRGEADLPAADRADAVAAARSALAADPVTVNATNGEPLLKSRTFVASLAVALTSAGTLIGQLAAESGFDWEVGGPLIGTLLASIAGLIGRVRSGLGPIRWWSPASWFGLAK
ncbi:MAG: hypothetical protein KIS96_03405 [Bauldia sp.]|nr:hypothetical protein [Bauldia sp.]